MTYFPKSQIKTNLYSTGEYVYLSNGEPYIGAYYKISTGKIYTGSTPSSPLSPQIILSPNKVMINGIMENIDPIGPPSSKSIEISYIFPYSQVNPQPPNFRSLPQSHQTLPTPQNYEDKIFSLYFAKKTNELKYKEISKQTYTLLKNKDNSIAWDLYEPIKLEWEIEGDKSIIFRNNKTTITKIEQSKKWYGFSKYLKEDYTKYWKSLNISNLYTPGGEFKTKNGQEYIGFYHIHNNTIPMVGQIHIKSFHETLIPIKPIPSLISNNIPISQTYNPQNNSSQNSSRGGGGSY